MRGKSPEKDRSERYLLTYADLMNLLLILFIVLFCTSTQDVVKANTVMQAIQEGFSGTTSKSSASGAGGNAATGTSSAATDYSDFYEKLIGLVNERGISGKVDITAAKNEVIITLKDNVLFKPGKADIDTDAANLLTNIGGLLKQISYGQLIIEGHTDSDPIHTAQFQDNVELSLIRAYNVSKIFKDCGIDSKKILPVGYGEGYPVAKNDTAANKAKNRRVVITILRKGLTPADESISSEDLMKTLQDAAVGKTESETSSPSSAASSSK